MIEATHDVPKKKHAGGRPKGRLNRKTVGRLLRIDDVFTDEIEEKGWNRILSSEDEQVFFRAFALAVSYKRGLPKQELKVSGVVGHVLTAADREAALAIIDKLKGDSACIVIPSDGRLSHNVGQAEERDGDDQGARIQNTEGRMGQVPKLLSESNGERATEAGD